MKTQIDYLLPNQKMADVVESVLNICTLKGSVSMEDLNIIETMNPGILDAVLRDSGKPQITLEDLSLLHKSLIGAGLLALIGIVMRLFGMGGGSSGGGGGGGGSSGGSVMQAKLKEASESLTNSEAADSALKEQDVKEELEELTSNEQQFNRKVSDADAEEIYTEIKSGEIPEGQEVPKMSRGEMDRYIKQKSKDITGALSSARLNRLFRRSDSNAIWDESDHTINWLKNCFFQGDRVQGLVNIIYDYMESVSIIFAEVEKHGSNNSLKQLFDSGYPSSDKWPTFDPPSAVKVYFLHHADNIQNVPPTIDKVVSMAELRHGSSQAMSHLKQKISEPLRHDTKQKLMSPSCNFVHVFKRAVNDSTDCVEGSEKMIYSLNDPDLINVFDDVERIHKTYMGNRYYPIKVTELYRDVKALNTICHNLLGICAVIAHISNKVINAQKTWSSSLHKDRRLTERLLKRELKGVK